MQLPVRTKNNSLTVFYRKKVEPKGSTLLGYKKKKKKKEIKRWPDGTVSRFSNS